MKQSIEEIKNKVDIVSIAEQYGFILVKKGDKLYAKQNLLRSEKTSSLFFYPITQSFCDFGNSNDGGDVITLIEKMENCTNTEAIEKLKAMTSDNSFVVEKREHKEFNKEKKPVDFDKLSYFATQELDNKKQFETKDNKVLLDKQHQKLFEQKTIRI